MLDGCGEQEMYDPGCMPFDQRCNRLTSKAHINFHARWLVENDTSGVLSLTPNPVPPAVMIQSNAPRSD